MAVSCAVFPTVSAVSIVFSESARKMWRSAKLIRSLGDFDVFVGFVSDSGAFYFPRFGFPLYPSTSLLSWIPSSMTCCSS